jgi:hypothetical protein
MEAQQVKEAPRVDIASIEKDLARSPSRHARVRMRVVVNPKLQPMPGGYVCEQGESIIIVPENKVASVLAMAATDRDREDMRRARERFDEELAKSRENGIADDMVGFSVQSMFRVVSGHDYPALDIAEVIDDTLLPPEKLLSEERALEASARATAAVVREIMFSKPDEA